MITNLSESALSAKSRLVNYSDHLMGCVFFPPQKSTLLYVLSTVFSVIVVALAIGVAFIYRYLLGKLGGHVQDALSVRTRN